MFHIPSDEVSLNMCIVTAHQRSFQSCVPVCWQDKALIWPLPMTHWTSPVATSGGGSHHLSITHDAFDLSIQAPPGHSPSPGPLLVTSGGHDLKPVPTCSLEDMTWASEWYASYWNLFWLKICEYQNINQSVNWKNSNINWLSLIQN